MNTPPTVETYSVMVELPADNLSLLKRRLEVEEAIFQVHEEQIACARISHMFSLYLAEADEITNKTSAELKQARQDTIDKLQKKKDEIIKYWKLDKE